MSSLYNEKTIEKIKKIRATTLKAFVTILILEIIVWAIVIIAKMSDITITRFQLTFLVIAGALFVNIINFRSIEKGRQDSQLMGTISLIASMIWMILQIVLIWKILSGTNILKNLLDNSLEALTKITSVASSTMVYTMLAGCVARVDENGGPIKPLKITSFVSALCAWIITLILTFGDLRLLGESGTTLGLLFVLSVLAFLVTGIAASVISRTNRKDKIDNVISTESIKNDANTQAVIQEMVEKEVQARLAAEKEKAEREALPPLQSEDMPPTIARDSELKIDAPNDIVPDSEPRFDAPKDAVPDSEPKFDMPDNTDNQ